MVFIKYHIKGPCAFVPFDDIPRTRIFRFRWDSVESNSMLDLCGSTGEITGEITIILHSTLLSAVL